MSIAEWAGMFAIGAVVLAIIGYIVKTSGSLTKTEQTAQTAALALVVLEARTLAIERSLADFKERSAREFVSHDVLRNFETRVVDAINRLGDRFDALLAAKITKE